MNLHSLVITILICEAWTADIAASTLCNPGPQCPFKTSCCTMLSNQAARLCVHRFRVVYRLVSQVYVMAVAPAFMNIFFSTQLINSVVHQLCTINRGINLTPEKLTGRFHEARTESGASRHKHSVA